MGAYSSLMFGLRSGELLDFARRVRVATVLHSSTVALAKLGRSSGYCERTSHSGGIDSQFRELTI
jgi:hypothetical protein